MIPARITPESHPTIYLSGPMTNMVDCNFPAFNDAAAKLRHQGFHVHNPAENFGGDKTRSYNDYMRLDLMLVTLSDAVVVLPGWKASRGVGMETTVARMLELPVVEIEDVLQETEPKESRPLKNLVAFAGYARSGKDEAGKALLKLGYKKHAFGDIIRRRVQSMKPDDIHHIFSWIKRNEMPDARVLCDVMTSYIAIHTHGYTPFTEDDTEKFIIRPLLERYGEAFYDEILTEYLSTLPKKAVNTRIVRVKEAQAWKERGGIIIAITRPGVEAATQWERERFEELRFAGVIDQEILNDGTVEDLHRKVLAAAAA